MRMNNSDLPSLLLASLLTLQAIGCGPSLRPAPPLVVTTREACLQQLGPPPPGVTLVASNQCPPEFAACLSKESAASLAAALAAWFVWMDQAWLLCGTLPSTSPAAPIGPVKGDGGRPSSSSPAMDAGVSSADGGP